MAPPRVPCFGDERARAHGASSKPEPHAQGATVSGHSTSRHRGSRPAPAPVVMRLLGHFEVRVDGHVTTLSAGPQRITAYLAVRGPTTRSRLAGELWPETTQDRALGCLRTAIWRVNRVS